MISQNLKCKKYISLAKRSTRMPSKITVEKNFIKLIENSKKVEDNIIDLRQS